MEADYVYDILAQGNCPALVSGAWFSDGKKRVPVWDTAGLLDAYRLASGAASCSAFDQGMRSLLELIRMSFLALHAAEDWLIPAECLDTDPGGVWFDPSEITVRFRLLDEGCIVLPEMDQRVDLTATRAAADLAQKLCSASFYPAADIAAQKINDAATEGAALKDLTKLVSSLQLLTRVV